MILENEKTYQLHKIQYEFNRKNLENVANLYPGDIYSDDKDRSVKTQLTKLSKWGEGILVFVDRNTLKLITCYVVNDYLGRKSDGFYANICRFKIRLFINKIKNHLASFLAFVLRRVNL